MRRGDSRSAFNFAFPVLPGERSLLWVMGALALFLLIWQAVGGRETFGLGKPLTLSEQRSLEVQYRSLPEHRLNLNRAGWGELKRLPGLGAAAAQRILEFRQAKGRFTSVDELAGLLDLSAPELRQIRRWVWVEE
ncbi:MAG: helix-hairpin-helix domain-containing protein [Candidatus Omnitrophica bacterium]|nr:helix-hairpin-helix domain-containing protein [Candidatus Omnitrophota bacterium]